MKKYVIITVLSLCSSVSAMDNTRKQVSLDQQYRDPLNAICFKSGWSPIKNDPRYVHVQERSTEWEPAIQGILTVYEQERFNNSKFSVKKNLRRAISENDRRSVINPSNLFVISKAKL